MKKLVMILAAGFMLVSLGTSAQCTKSASSCCSKKAKATASVQKVADMQKPGCCLDMIKAATYASSKEKRTAIKSYKKLVRAGEIAAPKKDCCKGKAEDTASVEGLRDEARPQE